MSKFSFYKKLLPSIIGALVLISVIFIVAYWFMLRGTLFESARSSFLSQTLVHSVTTEEHLNKLKDISLQVASRTKIRESLSNYDKGLIPMTEARSFIEPKLSDAIVTSIDAVGVIWMDKHLNKVAEVGSVERISEATIDIVGRDRSQIFIDGPLNINNSSHLRITTPILDKNGTFIGNNFVYYQASSLLNLVFRRLIPENDVLLLRAENGYQPILDFNYSITMESDLLKSLENISSVRIPKSGLIIDADKFTVSIAPVVDTPWFIASIQKNSSLFSDINRLLKVVFLLVLILLIIAILLIWRILSTAIGEINKYNMELESTNSSLTSSLRELNRAQDQLVQREKLAALGELVAGLMHELNTPLGNTVTTLSFLKNEMKSTQIEIEKKTPDLSSIKEWMDTQQEAFSIMDNNLSRAVTHIENFRAISMDQATLEVRRIELRNYVEEIIFSLKPKFKRTTHKIEIQCDRELSIITAPGLLSQILTNLIVNSLIHGFTNKENGHINIELYTRNHELYIIYNDDGMGIPETSISKIFEPYFTTKRDSGGTGLGLHIIYSLVVNQLQGDIHVKSKLSEGTTFEIHFPVTLA